MTLAHALGANGPEIEFLILAGGMLVLALLFFFQKTVKPQVPLFLLVGAFAVTAGAFAFGPDGAPKSDASVIIEDPRDLESIPAGRPLELSIEVRGGTLTTENSSSDPNAGHLHIFVDEALISMPSVETPRIGGEYLSAGEHVITVEFTQADHRSYEPPVRTSITVIAE